MNAQIRLAERQGLLVGHGLSIAQVAAVYYREIEDQAERRDRDRQEFKYVLLTSGVASFDQLFPDAVPVETDDNAEIESPNDGETIVYKFSEQDELDADEVERELAALMAGGDMTINGSEFDGQP